jgi:DnaJ-domain-containing protein 1
MAFTFEELVQAASQLSLEQKLALVYTLQKELPLLPLTLTPEWANAEIRARQASGVEYTGEDIDALRDQYARLGVKISDADWITYLNQVRASWEENEPDEFDCE